MLIEAIHPEIVETIKSTIKTVMNDQEIARIDVEAREDSTGDDAIFIDVFFRRSNAPFDSRKSSELRMKLWDRVYKFGDKRFPYIFYHYAKQEGEKS